MTIHEDLVTQKFDDFKKKFSQSIDLIGDNVDTFQILVKKHGFNLEEKLHAKALTRVKKDVLILLIKHFEDFKEDLKIYDPENVEEFEKRLSKSLRNVDQDLLDLDKY